MNDLRTMIWKETKDSVLQGGWSASIRPLLLLGILGLVVPWRFGRQWLALTPFVVGIVLYIPFIVILSFVGDAVAGERERHTLETLLASRIGDRAILLSKVIVTTGYAWGTALLGLLLGLIVANLSKGQGSWQFYTQGDILLETLALSLLANLLGVSGGVLISLRSATVRQAQQILIVATLVLVAGGGAGPQSGTSTGYCLVERFPVLAPCHSRACRARCDLAGSLAGELPPLTPHLELRRRQF